MGNEPPLEVFGFSGSAFVWRAMLALELKRLPCEMRWLEPTQEALKSPAYLKINPRGKVPALRHGNVVICESMAIMSYLDRLCPEPGLFGDDPRSNGVIWQLILDFDLYVAQQWGGRFIVPLFFSRAATQREAIKFMGAEIHTEFAKFNDLLERRLWLAGNAISAADVAVYPFVECVLRAAGKSDAKPLNLGFDTFRERYPNLDGLRVRIRELPGAANAFPRHWDA